MNLNRYSIPGRITTLALILASSIHAQALGPSEREVSLQGSRLTYYPRPALAQCQADCANNPNCKGATWINAGTYQPSDPAMCYLMSAVTGRSPARGHISGVKQVSAGAGAGRLSLTTLNVGFEVTTGLPWFWIFLFPSLPNSLGQ